MTDILERAQTMQRYVAGQTHVSIKLDLLQDMIAEIERLRADCAEMIRINNGGPATIRSITSKHLVSKGEGEPQ